MAYVNLLDVVYPVGSMYLSQNETSPATTIGGTWTKVEDDALIGQGTPGNYSGSKTISIDQMPNHRHIGPDNGYSWAIQPDNTSNRFSPIQSGPYKIADGDVAYLAQSGNTAWRWIGTNQQDKTNGIIESWIDVGGGQDYIPYHFNTNIWYRTA